MKKGLIGCLVLLGLIIAACLFLMVLPGRRLLQQATKEHGAIRQGMTIEEMFSTARSWQWAFGSAGKQGEKETPSLLMASFDGEVSVRMGDKSLFNAPNWDEFLAGVRSHEEAFEPCRSWTIMYRVLGSPAPGVSFAVEFDKQGKVASVAPLIKGRD